MSINVEKSNFIANQLMSTGGAAAIGALSSSILGLSIGASGGAIFGLASYVTGKTVQWICTKVFNLENPAANQAAKTISYVLGFFASIGAGMLAATFMGFPITFVAAIILSVATYIIPTAIAIIVALSCQCCIRTRDDNYRIYQRGY